MDVINQRIKHIKEQTNKYQILINRDLEERERKLEGAITSATELLRAAYDRGYVRAVKDVEEKNAENEHDGCYGCKYYSRSEAQEPCVKCTHNYADKFKRTDQIAMWITKTNYESLAEIYMCNVCREEVFAKTDFCPHCGAEMVNGK